MTKKCNRLRGERPKAFWGALVGGAMNLIGSAISSKSQARAIRRQIEAQKEAARTQLELANNSNLASTLNSYATATRSYNDEDDYNLKYRLGGNKRLGSNRIYITDGGDATKIGNDTYLLRGGSHEQTNETGQTGIGINVGGNEVEAEGGEVAQKKNGALRIFSAQPILGGVSPAQAVMSGANKDKVFNTQQQFKKRNGLKDDGSKAQIGGYYGANYPSPLSLLSVIYDKTLGRFDDKNPFLQTGTAPTPSRGLNLKQVRGGLVNKNMLRTNRVYRITNMREVKDAKSVGQYRTMPDNVTLPSRKVTIRRGLTFDFGKAYGNSHGGKAASMGQPWTGTTSGGYNESRYVISTPSRHTVWRVGHHGSYSKPLPADAIKKGSGIWKKFDAEGNTGISTKRMVVYKELGNGRYLRLPKSKYRLGGGLTSKDRGSSKHPYPSVSSKDFAGGGRSYPIPTKADAVDALRLAGLHGRSDVRSKVYSKYPSLRPKALGGMYIPFNKRYTSIYDAPDYNYDYDGGNVLGDNEAVITAKRIKPTFMKPNNDAMNLIKVPKEETPYIPQRHNRSRTIFSGGDYLGLGIDALSALGTGLITSNAYKNLDFNYNLPNFVEESPVALNTTYHNEAQKSNVERNRLNSRNSILRNTMSGSTAIGRMQGVDTNALYQLNQLADTKENKETELMNQNLLNEQQVRTRNAAARNQYYNTVATIKNAALEAKNNASLARSQAFSTSLSGLSQAWNNFWTAGRTAYEDDQARRAMIASSKDATPTRLIEMGYNLSPQVIASLYNTSTDQRTKDFYLSMLDEKQRRKYGIS